MTTFLASFPSPPQGVWHLGVIPIRAYALCIIVGIIVALVIGDRRWVARGGEQGVIYDIALWAVPFGLVGGRVYHVITDWPKYFGDDGSGFIAALKIWEGGLGIWGAVAFGGVGAWIGCRVRGIPLPAFGDAIAPGIVLAQAIGRVGNYFNQELYGRATSLPWGLEIYERRDAYGNLSLMDGVSTGQLAEPHPVHPTFLYELLWNVLVFVLLIWVDRRFKIGHGRLFALYVAAYCVGRFWVELLRNDPATLISGIRINSFTSTFVFIGAVVYVVLAPKGREDPKSLAGKPREPTTEEPEPEEPEKPEESLRGEDSELVEWTKGLVGAASTSGVVAGVAVAAADDDDEPDESSAETEAQAEESSEESEAAGESGQPANAEAEVAEEPAAEPDEAPVAGVVEDEPKQDEAAESAAETEARAEESSEVSEAPEAPETAGVSEQAAEAVVVEDEGTEADSETAEQAEEPTEVPEPETAEVAEDEPTPDEAEESSAETEAQAGESSEEPEPETNRSRRGPNPTQDEAEESSAETEAQAGESSEVSEAASEQPAEAVVVEDEGTEDDEKPKRRPQNPARNQNRRPPKSPRTNPRRMRPRRAQPKPKRRLRNPARFQKRPGYLNRRTNQSSLQTPKPRNPPRLSVTSLTLPNRKMKPERLNPKRSRPSLKLRLRTPERLRRLSRPPPT